jgi:NitT/TauT family transport system substrate-binding protein
LYVAIDAGFFAREDLSVTLTNTGGDELTWSAVLSGQVDFGVADPTFIAVAAQRGQPGKVIASIVNGVPFWGITTRDDIPAISTPADLGQYTIATFPSPSTAYTLQRDMFIEAGLKPDIREGAPGTLLAMVQAGDAEIALELEPNVSQALKDGARIVYSMKELYGDFAITGLTAKPEKVKNDPDLASRVVCALQRSLEFIRANPDQALEVLLKRFSSLDRDVAKAALTRVIDEDIVPEGTAISDIAWSTAIDLRQDVEELSREKSFDDLVDNTFSEQAQRECRGTTTQ